MESNTLNIFFEEKGLSKNSRKTYVNAVKQYTRFTKMSLENLIKEADFEEEERIRWKKRTLRKRLLDFRRYLYSSLAEGSAKLYFSRIKTIYTHFGIEIGHIPMYKSKQIDRTHEMTYRDILTREELKSAYYEANNTVKTLIVFGISSGLSKADMLDLTVADFLDACKEYITDTNASPIQQLEQLKKQEVIIPKFIGNRKKTLVRYSTYCSPEAVEHIISVLIGKHFDMINNADDDDVQLSLDDVVFDISESHMYYVFNKINQVLGLGKVGKFSKFRCHQLRKFQATTLLNSDAETWSIDEIDALQGRVMDATHRAYFQNNEDKLYEKYCNSVDDLMLFKKIHDDSAKVRELEKENKEYKNKMEEQDKQIKEILEMQEKIEQLVGL